jgi:hypothetical protein
VLGSSCKLNGGWIRFFHQSGNINVFIWMGNYPFSGLSDNREYMLLSQNTVAGEGSRVAPVGANIQLWFLWCRNETDSMLMGQIS